ncbi:Uncharacterized protein HZ326_18181 [Fusarium oxysporum f. sp. albedinis]|nr:Uncharacterized protein HZ326_18181 [Fusarium oxysporum f. sp. albedinis]
MQLLGIFVETAIGVLSLLCRTSRVQTVIETTPQRFSLTRAQSSASALCFSPYARRSIIETHASCVPCFPPRHFSRRSHRNFSSSSTDSSTRHDCLSLWPLIGWLCFHPAYCTVLCCARTWRAGNAKWATRKQRDFDETSSDSFKRRFFEDIFRHCIVSLGHMKEDLHKAKSCQSAVRMH